VEGRAAVAYFKALFMNFLEKLRETTRTSVRISGLQVEILTRKLVSSNIE
jgi:hypothetical protein